MWNRLLSVQSVGSTALLWAGLTYSPKDPTQKLGVFDSIGLWIGSLKSVYFKELLQT